MAPVVSVVREDQLRAATGRLGDRLLTAAAVLGLVVMALTVGAHVSGYAPLVVRSGSMEPTIPTGAMVLVREVPAHDIAVGDVVSVVRPDGTRVMHRVLAAERAGDQAVLTLKGDANEDPDRDPVVVSTGDELVFAFPAVGRAAALLASAKGGFVLGCLVTGLACSAWRRRD